MNFRKEYKYLLPNDMRDDLRKKLAPFVVLDNFAAQRDEREYTVRSIYYDTRRLQFYFEKIEGLKIRKKFRIRGYNKLLGEKVVYLEIKRKYENFGTKNRAPVLFGDLPELFRTGDIEGLVLSNKRHDKKNIDGKRFFYHIYRNSLVPTVLVVYDREAYFGKYDNKIRITFDKNLRLQAFPVLSGLYNEDKLLPALNNMFMLELKFERGFPTWLQNIVTYFGLSRMAVSKYAVCLDTHFKYYKTVNPGMGVFSNSVFFNQ